MTIKAENFRPLFAGTRKPQRARASAGSPEAFKMLTVTNMRRLCLELPPAALKVWLYHLSRSGKDDTSFAKLQTIASETNQNVETVKLARKWLRDHKWLEDTGEWRRLGGRSSVPYVRNIFPGNADMYINAVGNRTGGPRRRAEKPTSVASPRAEKPASENPPTEVDSNFFEVSKSSSGRADDDSGPKPDWNSIETKIDKHKLEASEILSGRGHRQHFVDAALHYIEERSDYSGSVPSSSNYFLVAFDNLLANPRDKAEIEKRAERRARVMPSEHELRATARILSRESEASGRPIKTILETAGVSMK